MTRSKKAWLVYLATRLCGVSVDAAVIALAYFAAFALRFDFAEPSWGWRKVAISCLTVLAVYLAALFLTGCYRLAWRRIAVRDLPRYILAMMLAGVVLSIMRFCMPEINLTHIRPPYSITVISFFFATAGIIIERIIWRLYTSSRVREAELISRDEIDFDNSAAARFLVGKTVMVTGAGGSIGSEITRQVAAAGAKRILLVERGENALYQIDREMRALNSSVEIAALMIDAGDEKRMIEVFEKEKPEVVLHAAAYKHVPMVEMNPEEGWRNNTRVTETLATLSLRYNVKRFVLISTDKAVNPVSVMGKTKRAAEEAIMKLAKETSENGTSFCAVRFGNVFGSSGSVVPLFREQIARKGPVTVTHPEMKRYFMTPQEAVSLVLQAASRQEQAIYTLDMGESVNILTLAEGMISQAGFRPYVDIPIVFTGIRPGEKLFEELDVSEKSCFRTDMAKIYITKNV